MSSEAEDIPATPSTETVQQRKAQLQFARANNPNYNGTNTQYGLPDYGNTNYGQDCSKVNTVDKHRIDSALIAALRDSKERDALLRLEAALCEFMRSDSGWVEVSGPYNSYFWTGGSIPPIVQKERHSSFQRCVLHRLADRFWIVREPGQLPGALRLIKVVQSDIPKVLLNDFAEDEISDALSRIQGYEAAAMAAAPVQQMKIMKRTNTPASLEGDDETKLNAGKRISITDKEKAYKEARDRIFNEQQQQEQEQQQQSSTKLTAEAPVFVPKGGTF